jgi:hypothetical protein
MPKLLEYGEYPHASRGDQEALKLQAKFSEMPDLMQ